MQNGLSREAVDWSQRLNMDSEEAGLKRTTATMPPVRLTT
jgi:hypothetical protein